jgi:isopentenyldiphosphate isomerase
MVFIAQDLSEKFDILPDPNTMEGIEITPDGVIVNPPSYLFEANKPVGPDGSLRFPTMNRADAHTTGAWHRAVGIWLYNDKGEVLLQKRSEEKDTHPLRWQSSAAGHVTSGDSAGETMVKEIFEETGLLIEQTELEFIGLIPEQEELETVKYGKIIDREYRFIYLAHTTKTIADCDFNPREVCELKFMPYRKVLDLIHDGDESFCPLTRSHVDLVRAALDAKNLYSQ